MKRTLIAILVVLLLAACDGTQYVGHLAPQEGAGSEGPLSEECFDIEAQNASRGDRDLGRYCREEN